MIRIFLIALFLFGCAATQFTDSDVDYFQPAIVSDKAPERPITNYSVYNNTIKVNLAPMRAIVPSFNGKGNLIASWNPHPKGVQGRPTFVIVHGGHGLIPGDFATALWARDELGANTLVLEVIGAEANKKTGKLIHA